MYKIIKGEFREGRVEGRAFFFFFFFFFVATEVLEPRYQTTQQTRQNGHKLYRQDSRNVT